MYTTKEQEKRRAEEQDAHPSDLNAWKAEMLDMCPINIQKYIKHEFGSWYLFFVLI